MKVLEICGNAAMDVVFVGSWSSVRAVVNSVLKSSRAWAGAVIEIMTQIDGVRGEVQVGNAGAMDSLDIDRLAVLRAGFKYLGTEDPLAQELYVALLVFLDGILPKSKQ